MTRILSRLLALSLVLSALAPVAAAQDVPTAGGALFVFGAPCDDPRAGTGAFAGQLSSSSGAPCAPFTRDQQNYLTPITMVGSSVDVNLYLANPGKLPVSKVQAWIAYDPEALTGSILSVDGAFPGVNAAETGFFPQEGYVKLSATAGSSGAPADEQILVATLRIRPLKAVDQSTILSFYQLTGSGAKTLAMSGSAASGTNILDGSQPSLSVRIAPAASSSSVSSAVSSSAASSSSVASSSSTVSSSSRSSVMSSSRSSLSFPSSSSSSSIRPMSSSSSLTTGSSEFRRQQVQGVAIGTQNGSALIGWQMLPGATGYHVYYSTVSGVYTQRRTLAAGATGDTITGLPNGDRYFFAVRAVNADGVESDYSREVAVVIGQPNTATTPLIGSVTTGPTPVGMQQLTSPGNKTVAGKTGVDDMAMVLIGIAAVVGMWCAFRRQLSASPVA